MRLDQFLTENQIYKSRTRAERAIKESCVKVNGCVVTKCSFEVGSEDKVEALPDPLSYVSRGALKLVKAIDCFKISIEGRTCIDVGSSTGGFTEVLLQNGAEKVYAVDVGRDQLDPKIKENPKVVSMEKTDIRSLDLAIYGEMFDVLTCDCSFISLKAIVPMFSKLLKQGGVAVLLVKPQFEVGRKFLNKKGIVTDEKIRKNCLIDIIDFCEKEDFKLLGEPIESPITGGDGNVEYLAVLKKIINVAL